MPRISALSTNASTAQTPRLASFGKFMHLTLLWAAFCATAQAQTACPAGTTTQDFAFTGAQASYVVPTGATQIALQAFGAQGNAGAGAQGGAGALGGSATGTLATTPGQTLYVVVGGQGNTFNGGGLGATLATGAFAGGNGGGASDVRAGTAAVGSRVLVAGGGGGGGGQALNNAAVGAGGAGGAGGGGNGGNGANTVAGGGGFGGQPGIGGAPGIGCSFAVGTAGNGTTGQGGNASVLGGGFFGGAGGGGGGGATVGGGGGGGTAGTTMCTANDTGAGGGGAGGTSAAFAGVSSFLSANGVRSGNGTVRMCVPNTAQTLTFSAQPSQNFVANGTFNVNPLATSASPNSGNSITYASTTPSVCTVSGTTVTMVSSGACNVTANQVGDTVYLTAAQVSQNITINPGSQTLTFPAQSPASQTFAPSGTFPINPLATSASPNSGNAIAYSSLTTGVCTVAGTTVTIVSTGTCTLAANQAGNANYAAAAQVTRDVTIGLAAQTLTFPAQSPASQTFAPSGTFPISPLATSASPNSGNAITHSSLTTGVCTVAGTTVTIVSTGTCTLAANQAGNANYAVAAQATQDVVIAVAAQVVTFPSAMQPTRPFILGGTFVLNPVATGGASGNPITYSAGPSGVCSISGTTVTMLGVGTCVVTANQAAGSGYAAALPATQVIAFAAEAAAVPVPTLSQWLFVIFAGLLGLIGWRATRAAR